MFKLTNKVDGITYYLGSVLEEENPIPRKFFLGYDSDMVHVFKPDVVRDSEEDKQFLELFITLVKAANIGGQVERV